MRRRHHLDRWRPLVALGVLVALVAPHAQATNPAGGPGALVVTGGTLIDGTGREPVPGSTIVVRDGRVTEVTAGGAHPPGAGGDTIDARGKWIVPGLIDMHVHSGRPRAMKYHPHGTRGVRTLVALLMAFPVVVMTTAAAPGQTIKIGASVALTGSLSREGSLLKEGYVFWPDHVNQSGGILAAGRRHAVQLVVYDDESSAATGARLTQKLIAVDKVQFLLGPYSSPITLETSLVGEKHRILTIAALANADAIYVPHALLE